MFVTLFSFYPLSKTWMYNTWFKKSELSSIQPSHIFIHPYSHSSTMSNFLNRVQSHSKVPFDALDVQRSYTWMNGYIIHPPQKMHPQADSRKFHSSTATLSCYIGTVRKHGFQFGSVDPAHLPCRICGRKTYMIQVRGTRIEKKQRYAELAFYGVAN